MTTYLNGGGIEKEPNLLFDKTDTSAVDPTVYWGLRRFGPYDKDISCIKVAIISPKDKLEHVRKLINDLKIGTPIMPGGMKQFFRCNIEVVKEDIVPSQETNDYISVGINFVETTDPRSVDVVIAFIPKTSRFLSNTPYYRLKAILTSRGFCSQMITNATFENLKWSYLNLACAIFSKAGGIPWVLESEMKDVDLIIGISISNCVSYKHRAGNRPRYVGYVNVFDNYGRWMFFEGTATLYERGQNAQQLRELLEKAIRKFESEKGYLPKSLVIHYYKRFGSEEKKTTIDILRSILNDFYVAFVSIDDSHPMRIYDLKVDDGSFPRGKYVYLSQKTILLSTTGYTEIARKRMGTPKLLRISVDQFPDEFLTLDDIAEQVFALTKLDWATATPIVREPVTLQFSRQVTYLTAAISEQEWRSIVRPEVNIILNRRPWFI